MATPDGPTEREADRIERSWASSADHDDYDGEYVGEGEEGCDE